jgi:hypothetical protein
MTDETKRDRVRRLLIEPLGFRKPGAMSAEACGEMLVKVCDELAYLSDEGLARVEEALRCRGTGKDRNGWPDLATFRAYAELAEPRPIEELPALRRWFGSVEGPRAIEEGTLVETWSFFLRHKRPPAQPQDKRVIAERASANRRRLELVDDRRKHGRMVEPQEAEWARQYRARRAYLDELVRIERAERGAEVAG